MTGGNVEEYKISPDGALLAFLADDAVDEEFNLFVAAIDGSSLIKLNPDLATDTDVDEFHWSPDSSQLLFTSNFENPGASNVPVNEVYIVAADGSSTAEKINGAIGMPPVVRLVDVSWSPNGRYVAQIVQELPSVNGRRSGINIHDTEGSAGNSLRVTPTTNSFTFFAGYQQAPDSSRLAYRGDQDTDSAFELYSVQPDGSKAATETSTNGLQEIFTVRPNGSGNTKVNSELSALNNIGQEFFWSTDSRWIGYIADQQINVDELFVARSNGSSNRKAGDIVVAGGNVQSFPKFMWLP